MMHYKNYKSLQLHVTPMLVGLAFFMQTLDGSLLNTALPTIAKSLGENPLYAQSVIFAYVLTVGIFLPLSGWVFEKFGSLKTLIFAVSLFTFGSFLCSLTTTFSELIFCRIVQGIGGGLMVPAGRLEVLKLYPKRIMVPVLSFIMIPGLLGTAVGPAVGGIIVEYAAWQWLFLLNIPIGILYAILCYFWMPNIKEKQYRPFDIIGFFIFVFFSIIISIAVNDSKFLPVTPDLRIILFALSIFIVFVYYLYARHKDTPLFGINIFKIKEFSIGIIGNIFSRLGGGAIPFLVPLMLQLGLGFSPSKTGFYMLIMGLMVVFGKFLAPTIMRILGYKYALITITALLFIFTLVFFYIEVDTPEYIIIILISIFGILNSLQFSALTALTLIDLPPEHLSQGNSIMSVVMQISYSIGIGIGGFSLAIFSKYLDLSSGINYLPAFHDAFLVIASLTILPVMFYFFLPAKVKKYEVA